MFEGWTKKDQKDIFNAKLDVTDACEENILLVLFYEQPSCSNLSASKKSSGDVKSQKLIHDGEIVVKTLIRIWLECHKTFPIALNEWLLQKRASHEGNDYRPA